MIFAYLGKFTAILMLLGGLYGIYTGFVFVIEQASEVQDFAGLPFAETPQLMKDSYRLVFWSLVLGTISEIAIAMQRSVRQNNEEV